jgi:poly-gamma-glutamate synthesis protein (capsule biosynthesis protein)
VLSDRGFTVNHRYLLSAPPERADLLRAAGITALNLANNHSMDCGSEGLTDTMEALNARHLALYGAGDCTVLSVRGLRIAFVGFCDFPPSASEVKPTGPTIAYATDETVKRSVVDARRLADSVVAVFHWGTELSDRENPRQVHLAHLAAQAGAALVLGHHPHVYQPIVWYRVPGRGRFTLIAYSLGNFVFDGRTERERHAILLSCRIGREGIVDAMATPVEIVRGAPRPSGSPRTLRPPQASGSGRRQ